MAIQIELYCRLVRLRWQPSCGGYGGRRSLVCANFLRSGLVHISSAFADTDFADGFRQERDEAGPSAHTWVQHRYYVDCAFGRGHRRARPCSPSTGGDCCRTPGAAGCRRREPDTVRGPGHQDGSPPNKHTEHWIQQYARHS
jgi:hypothetical protein